jgi:hypothetical protein
MTTHGQALQAYETTLVANDELTNEAFHSGSIYQYQYGR